MKKSFVIICLLVIVCLVVMGTCFLRGCEVFEYCLVSKGEVKNIELTGGGFMNPSKRVFYLDDGSVNVFGENDYTDVKIGDFVYIYHRDWDGWIVRQSPLR